MAIFAPQKLPLENKPESRRQGALSVCLTQAGQAPSQQVAGQTPTMGDLSLEPCISTKEEGGKERATSTKGICRTREVQLEGKMTYATHADGNSICIHAAPPSDFLRSSKLLLRPYLSKRDMSLVNIRFY